MADYKYKIYESSGCSYLYIGYRNQLFGKAHRLIIDLHKWIKNKKYYIEIPCDDIEGSQLPDISLFGYKNMESLLLNYRGYFWRINTAKFTKFFNDNLCDDNILKRLTQFNEYFDTTAENIIKKYERMVCNERKYIFIKNYGNVSGLELGYECSICKKINTPYLNFDEILCYMLFGRIDNLSFLNGGGVNMCFIIYSDAGNIRIDIKNDFVPDSRKNYIKMGNSKFDITISNLSPLLDATNNYSEYNDS